MKKIKIFDTIGLVLIIEVISLITINETKPTKLWVNDYYVIEYGRSNYRI